MSDYVDKMVQIKLSFENDMSYLKDALIRKKEYLKFVTDFIRENCVHEWVDDYIDIDVEKGMNIRYCKHCELAPT